MSYRMKPMLPTLSMELPQGADWIYEIKYDGYRCMAYWSKTGIELISRNGQPLTHSFPEVTERMAHITNSVDHMLPLVLDGEICILHSRFKAAFDRLQARGRLKDVQKIQQAANQHPATYMVFDVLVSKGNEITSSPLLSRKKVLQELFQLLSDHDHQEISCIEFSEDNQMVWSQVKEEQGEGVIAKRKNSKYTPGDRTKQWQKIKNPQTNVFFIAAYEKNNGYFHVGALRDNEVYIAGLFSHGLSSEEREALISVVKNNKVDENEQFVMVSPSICVELQYLEIYKEQLRHPRFVRFRLDVSWEECTWEKVISNKSS